MTKFLTLFATTAVLLFLYSCSSSDEMKTNGASLPLQDQKWTLRTLMDKKVYVPEGGKEIFITFLSEGNRFTGSGGCNTFFGNYKTSGSSLTCGNAARTEMYCEGRMETEDGFLRALSGVKKYEISRNKLTLKDSSGKTLATLESVDLK